MILDYKKISTALIFHFRNSILVTLIAFVVASLMVYTGSSLAFHH